MNIMLLAAGEGTRLNPYTLKKPKPAIPFLTVPLAGYSLSLIERIPVHNLVVNTYHLPDQIEYLFKDIKRPDCKLKFSSEKNLLLGSGGGIHAAKKLLSGHGDFLVMNADEIILPHQLGLIEDFIHHHKVHKPLASLLTMKHPEVGKKFGGVWTQDGEKVSLFSKTNPGEQFQGHHFLGVMIFSEKIFSYFKPNIEIENILYETLTKALHNDEKVLVFDAQCEWFESGNPMDFVSATNYCLDAIQNNSSEYWVDYLKQVIRIHGWGHCMIEQDYPAVLEKIKTIFQEQQFNYFPERNDPFSL